MLMSTMPPPSALGAPEKFSEWRPVQEAAALRHMSSEQRFVMSAMPTGAGKSLMYVMVALMTGQRTCILTSTKGLQSQLMRDFREAGMVDVRGMNAYNCVGLSEGEFGDPVSESCDSGPCRSGAPCSFRQNGCLYFDAVREASEARIVVTNYAYYMYMQGHGKGIGTFDRLVLDEAHDAVGWLCEFLSNEITETELSLVGSSVPGNDLTPHEWRKWAEAQGGSVERRLEIVRGLIVDTQTGLGASPGIIRSLRREARQLAVLGDKLEVLRDLDAGWVIERSPRLVKFSIVWPAKHAERCLFRGIPHVDFVSATIRPKTAELLGVPKSDLDFADYPSDFPAKRRPVIHVPTVRMNHHNTPADEQVWLEVMDQIISDRRDRKGIVHTVSYKRRDLIMAHSVHRDILLAHTPATTRSVFEEFKRAQGCRVLVSPAATTGWDFPAEECEYQIVTKIPFPDLSSAVMKARAAQDKKYGAFMAVLTLVQMVGRGMRSAEDQCETLVLDDNIKWFLWQYREFLPRWFTAACTSVGEGRLPKPLPKM